MTTLHRSRTLRALIAVAAVGAAALVVAHPSHKPVVRDAHASDTLWTTADSSVYADPASVVEGAAAGAGENTKLRLTTIRNEGGRAELDSTTVTGVTAAENAVERAQDDLAVVAVSVDSRVSLAEDVTATATANDALRPEQWALNTLKAESVWKRASGSGTVVAVVDTGVTGSHEDLRGQVRSGAEFLGGGGGVSTGNGQRDPHGHGTHVAGIITAVKGNKVGVAGLAPTSTVLPVRVMDADGSGWNSDVAAGIIYATDSGAHVISLSLSGAADGATRTAVEYAVNHGVLVVASAGNDRAKGNAVAYPAAYPGVLAVASSDKSGASSSFSNTGSYVDIAAPGGNILSTLPAGYGLKSGTSMAAPYVSAAAALVRDASSGRAGATELAAALERTATDAGRSGRDNEFGAGIVNPNAAVCLYASCPGSTPAPVPVPAPTPTPAPAPSKTTPAPSVPLPSNGESSAATTRLQPTPPTSYTWYGSKARMSVRLYNNVSGASLSGQYVTLTGYQGKSKVFTKRVRTNSSGTATLSKKLVRTTTVKATSAATSRYKASTTTVGKYTVLPTVKAFSSARSAQVTVKPALRQLVRFQVKTSNGWKTRKTVKSSKSGTAKATGLKKGTWRIFVGPGSGVASITTGSWKVR